VTVASLQQLKQWRDSLVESRLSGIRTLVDQNGERVEYKSDSEMRAAIESVNREIQSLERPQPSVIRFQTSKGL